MNRITQLLIATAVICCSWQSSAQFIECGQPDLTPVDVQRILQAIDSRMPSDIIPVGPITVPFQPHIIRTDAGTGGSNPTTVMANITATAGHYAAYNILLDVKPINYINNTALMTLGSSTSDGIAEGDANLPAFNVAKHVNAYFIQNAWADFGGETFGLIGGYARFPWNLPVEYFTVVDGNLEPNGATVAHEMGHY